MLPAMHPANGSCLSNERTPPPVDGGKRRASTLQLVITQPTLSPKATWCLTSTGPLGLVPQGLDGSLLSQVARELRGLERVQPAQERKSLPVGGPERARDVWPLYKHTYRA